MKHHLTPNTVPHRFVHKPGEIRDYKLNADSEKVRKQYSFSAPPRGITGKQTAVDSVELKPRYVRVYVYSSMGHRAFEGNITHQHKPPNPVM